MLPWGEDDRVRLNISKHISEINENIHPIVLEVLAVIVFVSQMIVIHFYV